jgi:oxygen-independent coproporphyrinogen-3 oxidase
VIAAIADRYSTRVADLEITLEANPTDVDADRLAAWRAAGVSRLSIGVQSTHADELRVLGRDHRFGDGPAAIARALAHGGFVVTCDFILGTPVARRGDLAWIDALPAVDHVSVYELTIVDGTAFGVRAKDGRLVPRSDDELAELYAGAHDRLTARGFEHYEVSSYARPGKRAVHNSLYWVGAPYLGLGASAASLAVFPDGTAERATNPRRVSDYLAGAAPEVVAVGAREMADDRAWLGMRTVDGVATDALAYDVVAFLVREQLAERRGDRICPTLRGFLFADRVAARIAGAL